jgi:uncharacterized protein YggT (Ycf19 family)
MLGGLIIAAGGFIEILIGMRFALRLIGANPASSFVQWIYNWSTPFVTPFAGVLGQPASLTGPGVVTTSVFDWSALVAFVIIGVIVSLLGRVFSHH